MYNRNAWGTRNGLRTLLALAASMMVAAATLALAGPVAASHLVTCDDEAFISWQPAGATAKAEATIYLNWVADSNCTHPVDCYIAAAGDVYGEASGAAYEYRFYSEVSGDATSGDADAGTLPEGLADYHAEYERPGETHDVGTTGHVRSDIDGAIVGDRAWVVIDDFGCEDYQDPKYRCGPGCNTGEGTLVTRVG